MTLWKAPASEAGSTPLSGPEESASAGLEAAETRILEEMMQKEAPAPLPPGGEAEYVGVEACKLCHMPHFESWAQTRMARAFDLLRPGVRSEAKKKVGLDPQRDYTTDPQCLRCHVTGYGQAGGFVSLEKTPEMANVQCEMCHGPGSIYVEMMLKKQGTYTLEEYRRLGGLTMPSVENNVCTDKCHNPASPFAGAGYRFDFEDRKAMGTHKHDLNYIYMPFEL